MNDFRPTNPNHDDALDARALSDAQRLRALADAELPPGAEADLRAADDAGRLERAVAFERALRERVAAVMSVARAPEGLRDRISAALAEERRADAPAPSAEPNDADVISRRDRSFWSSGPARLLAIAAAVALVATAFVFSPAPPAPAAPTILTRASEHISAEHAGCITNPDYFTAKMTAPAASAAGVESLIASQIGDLPVHLELDDAGFTLAGLGGCHIPGGGDSVHLLYQPNSPDHTEPVSLFIQQATDAHSDLAPGVVYSNGRAGPPMIRIWREGDVVYHIVTECPISCDTAEAAYALTGERTAL